MIHLERMQNTKTPYRRNLNVSTSKKLAKTPPQKLRSTALRTYENGNIRMFCFCWYCCCRCRCCLDTQTPKTSSGRTQMERGKHMKRTCHIELFLDGTARPYHMLSRTCSSRYIAKSNTKPNVVDGFLFVRRVQAKVYPLLF